MGRGNEGLLEGETEGKKEKKDWQCRERKTETFKLEAM